MDPTNSLQTNQINSPQTNQNPADSASPKNAQSSKTQDIASSNLGNALETKSLSSNVGQRSRCSNVYKCLSDTLLWLSSTRILSCILAIFRICVRTSPPQLGHQGPNQNPNEASSSDPIKPPKTTSEQTKINETEQQTWTENQQFLSNATERVCALTAQFETSQKTLFTSKWPVAEITSLRRLITEIDSTNDSLIAVESELGEYLKQNPSAQQKVTENLNKLAELQTRLKKVLNNSHVGRNLTDAMENCFKYFEGRVKAEIAYSKESMNSQADEKQEADQKQATEKSPVLVNSKVNQSSQGKQTKKGELRSPVLIPQLANFYINLRAIEKFGFKFKSDYGKSIISWQNELPVLHIPRFSQLFEKSVSSRSQGGIPNLGNSCYLASALQFMTPLLTLPPGPIEYDNRGRPPENQQKREKLQDIVATALRFKELPHDPKTTQSLTMAMYDLRFHIYEGNFNHEMACEPGYGYNRQQDGADAGNILAEIMNWNIKLRTTRSGTQNAVTKTSEITEPARLISLVIPNKPSVSFQELITDFFSVHPISEPIKIQEQQFKEYHAHQQLEGNPPEFLLFQAKRFERLDPPTPSESDRGVSMDGTQRKLSTKITFAKDGVVDFSKAWGQSPGTTRYRVVGVQTHVGDTPDNGHYTAAVRGEKGWNHYDDDEVTPVQNLGEELAQGYNYCLQLIK